MQVHKFREPYEYEIQRAHEDLYMEKLLELMAEALSEADDLRRRRIAQSVIACDAVEVGQIVTDVLEAYCKPTDEDAYLRAKELIEFGERDE